MRPSAPRRVFSPPSPRRRPRCCMLKRRRGIRPRARHAVRPAVRLDLRLEAKAERDQNLRCNSLEAAQISSLSGATRDFSSKPDSALRAQKRGDHRRPVPRQRRLRCRTRVRRVERRLALLRRQTGLAPPPRRRRQHQLRAAILTLSDVLVAEWQLRRPGDRAVRAPAVQGDLRPADRQHRSKPPLSRRPLARQITERDVEDRAIEPRRFSSRWIRRCSEDIQILIF